MAIQQSVAQQNAKTTAEVRHTAELFAARPKTLAWVGALLESHGLHVNSGILVRMFETPEQDGNLVGGVWLTNAQEFWEFRAVVSRANGELLYVETFENITASVAVNKHVPGTGQSFGYIAIEVNSEVAGA
jgi:hypothetical protein